MGVQFQRTIGVDVGGTKILACAINEEGVIVDRFKCETPVNEGAGKSSARHSIGVRLIRAVSRGTTVRRGAE